MTDLGTDILSQIINLLTEVLTDVQKGRLLTLERMGVEFQSLYARLDTEIPADTDQRLHKTRLKTLSRLHAHLEEEVKALRGSTLQELGKVNQGRRSLTAYKAAVSMHERGAKRGEG